MNDCTKKRILVVETGIHGGGSFASLYHSVLATSARFEFIVVFLVENKWMVLLEQAGIRCYVVSDLQYHPTANRALKLIAWRLYRGTQVMFPFLQHVWLSALHLSAFRCVRSLCKTERIDMLVTNTDVVRDTFALVAARSLGLPCASHLRGIPRDMKPGYFRPSWYSLNVSRFIANSSFCRRRWIEAGLPEEKIDVVYNPCSREFTRAGDWDLPVEVQRTLESVHGREIVGSVGRLDSWKRQCVLLEATSRLVDRGCPVCTVLVGDGPCRRELEEHAQRLGVSESVVFLGWMDNPDSVMSAFAVSVVPSVEEPGFARTAMDSWRLGVPLVGCDSGALPEGIEDAKNGLLFAPDDAETLATCIQRIVRDGELARRLVAGGRRKLAMFSPDRYRERYSMILNNVLRAGNAK